MSATVKIPETLAQVLTRITDDSNAVGHPVTAGQLAAAAIACGYRHPQHPGKTTAAIQALTDAIRAQWQPGSDPHTVAALLTGAGWVLGSNVEWRHRRMPRPGGGSITDHCKQGHGPDQWNHQHDYCRACRARKRAAQRANTRKDTAA